MAMREAAAPVREVEPGVLRGFEVGEPARSPITSREVCAQLVLVGRGADGCADSQLERETSEAPKLVVGAQDEDIDARDHLRDGVLRDLGEGSPAEVVEDEIGGVAEIEELEVVLQDPVEPVEEAVVGDEQDVARAHAACFRDDRLVLVLGQLRDRQQLELAYRLLDLLEPARVKLIPVLVVIAASSQEKL